MSSFGLINAQIIERQREETRKQGVRAQCNTMAGLAAEKFRNVINDPQYSGLIDNADSISQGIDDSLTIAKTDPDRALIEIQTISEKVNNVLSMARSKEQQWSEDRRNAYANISRAADELRAIPVKSEALKDEISVLISRVDSLLDLSAPSSQLVKQVGEIKEKSSKIRERDEKETVRKEIAKKIVAALKTRGFIVENPRIKDEIVFINAKIPGGKTALFQIRDDNKLKFDFDGYEGTTCKDELDAILEKVNSGDSVEMEVEQFVWHNPDRIKKGAKDLPYGQSRYMSGSKMG